MSADSVIKTTFSILAKVTIAALSLVGALALLIVGVVFMVVKSMPSTQNEPPVTSITRKSGGENKVAIIPISGQIVAGGQSSSPLDSSSVSAKEVIRILRHAEKDASVKAIVIRMDTPGGAVVASDEIYREVLRIRDIKPIIVSMGDQATSGGYYISAGATKIIANSATITGSIGVIASLPQYSKLYEKIGVQKRTFKSGLFKDLGSSDRDMTPDEEKILDTMILEAYDQFVSAISKGRKMDETKVRTLADGRIYTGKQAFDSGLIDGLGTLDDALTLASSEAGISNATIIEYSGQSLIQSLLSGSISQLILPYTQFGMIPSTPKFGIYYQMAQ